MRGAVAAAEDAVEIGSAGGGGRAINQRWRMLEEPAVHVTRADRRLAQAESARKERLRRLKLERVARRLYHDQATHRVEHLCREQLRVGPAVADNRQRALQRRTRLAKGVCLRVRFAKPHERTSDALIACVCGGRAHVLSHTYGQTAKRRSGEGGA